MKAQVSSQVFVYIFAVIIVSITLLIGYKLIGSMTKGAYQKTIDTFKIDLSSAIESRSMEYGSVEKLKLNLPSEYATVCFVNSDFSTVGEIDAEKHPMIKDSVDSGTKQNVFLLKSSSIESFFVERLEVEDVTGLLCIDNINGVRIRVEGMGNRAKISEDTS